MSGMKSGFLTPTAAGAAKVAAKKDQNAAKGASGQSEGVADVPALIKRLQTDKADMQRQITALVSEVRQLKDWVAQLIKQQGQAKADAATTERATPSTLNRLQQLEERQEKMAQQALASTVMVHAYSASGASPSDSDVQLDLLRATNLAGSTVISCVQIAVSSSDSLGGAEPCSQDSEVAACTGAPGGQQHASQAGDTDCSQAQAAAHAADEAASGMCTRGMHHRAQQHAEAQGGKAAAASTAKQQPTAASSGKADSSKQGSNSAAAAGTTSTKQRPAAADGGKSGSSKQGGSLTSAGSAAATSSTARANNSSKQGSASASAAGGSKQGSGSAAAADSCKAASSRKQDGCPTTAGSAADGTCSSAGSPLEHAKTHAPVVCTTFKVVLATPEAARQLLITKAKHKQLGTGLVIRAALTPAERQMQLRYMPLYRQLRRQGIPADFRRAQLWARRDGKWAAVPLP